MRSPPSPHPTLAMFACVLLLGACAPRARTPDTAPAGADAPAAPVRVLAEHYAHSLAALGAPGARRAFQVGDGSQVATGDVAVRFVFAGGGPVRTSPVWFESDGVPVAHWWMASARESVTFEAAAAPRTALGDTSLELAVLATVVRGDASALELRLATRPEGPTFTPWDASDSVRFAEGWHGVDAMRNGALVARLGAGWVPPSAPAAEAPVVTSGLGDGALRTRGTAGARTLELWLPAYPVSIDAAAPRAYADVAAAARRLWRGWLAKAAPFSTTDTLVDAAYRAALVTLVLDHERDRGEWVPIGNPLQYRDVWLRDGARAIRALARAGLGEFARSDARTLLRFQLEPGVLLSQKGQLDGTGFALWAFDQASSLPPDPALAKELLPAAVRAREWIDTQRSQARARGLEPAGLLPPGDPQDNELVQAPLVGNDAWTIAGCEALARMAARAGDAAAAEAARRTAAAHRADFGAALARFGGGPVAASWRGDGRDWGNLQLAYPTRALEPDDPRVLATEARARGRSTVAGLVSYGPADTLHTYLGHDPAMNALLRGDAAGAWITVRALLEHSSSTLGQAETFHANGGFGRNLPPHGTSAADLADLLQSLLALDDGDTLVLAAGAPLSWWNGASLARTPTPYGLLDLSLAHPAADRLHARWGGANAPVRLRVPDGRVATSASGGAVVRPGGRWVVAPAGVGDVEIGIAADGAGR